MVETGVELDNKSIIILSRCLVGLLCISQVENLLLEVLTANFRVQQSVRAIVSNNSFSFIGFRSFGFVYACTDNPKSLFSGDKPWNPRKPCLPRGSYETHNFDKRIDRLNCESTFFR